MKQKDREVITKLLSKGGGSLFQDRSFPFFSVLLFLLRIRHSVRFPFHGDITFSLLFLFFSFSLFFLYIFSLFREFLSRRAIWRSISRSPSYFPFFPAFIPCSAAVTFLFQWYARSMRYKCEMPTSWRVTQECSGARYQPLLRSTSRLRPGWKTRPSTFTRPRRAVSTITDRSRLTWERNIMWIQTTHIFQITMVVVLLAKNRNWKLDFFPCCFLTFF